VSDDHLHLETGQGDDAEARPLPVLAEVHPIEPVRPVPLPVAVAAATGGFLLGVATFVLVRVLRRPRAGRRVAGSRFGRKSKGLEITASRSFLVDVHLLKDR
jgi:hypothetical protein